MTDTMRPLYRAYPDRVLNRPHRGRWLLLAHRERALENRAAEA